MDNKKISQILSQTADILEIKEANPWRINAYRQASHYLENLEQDINLIAQKNKLQTLPGIGPGLANYINDLIKTGTCAEFKKLKKEVPLSVLKLLEIEGLGPKKLKFLFKKFKITSLYKLEKLLQTKKLFQEENWGEKSVQNLIQAVNAYKFFHQRFLLGEMEPLGQSMVQQLKKSKLVNQIEICGSMRRGKSTIGDMDILITSQHPLKVIKLFTTLEQVKKIISQGKTKSQVILKQGIKVDLRVVKDSSFGAAVHYFTGSKAHNISIRKLAQKKNLRINEYGVFKKQGQTLKKIGGEKEKEIFKAVDLPWIPPVLRENNGEIKAGLNNQLPCLIKLKDIKGDAHLHTKWSDGKKTILEMAQAGQKEKYEYIAITDHASPLGMIHGLNSQRVASYLKAIKRANQKIKGIKILAGVEVDIMKNGRLYLSDHILKKFDLVVAAVHSSLKMEEKAMTQRICQAISNPYVHILAHPTNRLINKRESSKIDLKTLFQKARQTKTILELNAFWRRLDLNSQQARWAKEQGVKMIISTDAHHSDNLKLMKYGVINARRGWLEKKDVINTLPYKKFLKALK
jgi:DNA polymerase (family X)